MTRRDYIELAETLRRARVQPQVQSTERHYFNLGVDTVASYIADLCASRDPKFDVQRFLKNAREQS